MLIRPLLALDVLKLRYWETFFCKQAKKVVAMSESDREEMQKLVKDLNIDTVPNGIDENYFSARKREADKQTTVLYVGNFAWLQNVEAVEALVNKVWPRIKEKMPVAKLWIVGMNMTDYIRGLAAKGIEITEKIPDVRDAYRKANVLVTPIKGPGGTRLKILEAMASGLPVITTSVGAEGLGVKNGEEVIIEDNLESMADSAVKVLKDRNLANRLGVSGKKFVEYNYTWAKSAWHLDEIYEQVVYAK
jgi:glycosyltransferase involved in cell wall biosynthesis